jgi:hypothetical protein
MSTETRRGALAGAPVSQMEESLSDTEPTAGAAELQAQKLRNHYAVAYNFACSLAPLVWGLPR